MSAPPVTLTDVLPRTPGAGTDIVAVPNAPEETIRLWIKGENFPRLVLDTPNSRILAGNGTIAPTALPAGGGGGGDMLAANNLSDLASVATARTNLGLGSAAVHPSTDFDAAGAASTAQSNAIAASQPVDADLTAIAALTTTSYGRAFLALADAGAGRTALGLGTASTQASTAFDASGAAAAAAAASQPLDADLTAIAAISTTSFGRGLLALANASALAAAGTLAGDVTGAGNANTLAATANVESIIRANSLDQLTPPAANLSLNSKRILNLADPVLGTDAVTLEYLLSGWITDPNTWTVVNVPTVSGGTTTVASSLVTATAHGFTNGMSVIISGLTNTTGTGLSNGCLYYIVGVTTNTYQLSLTSGGAAITFGGTADAATVVATGQNQFTVPVDATSYLAPGTKISYNDGGVDYGVVRSAVNNSGTTTVTLITTSDFSIANATLTAPRFSHEESPVGFPAAFAWTPTLVGWSSNPTAVHYRWSARGRRMKIDVFQFTAGTSNATAHTLTLPVIAATVAGMGWNGVAQAKDNNVIAAGYLSVGTGSQTVTGAGIIATGLNTASGNSSINGAVEYDF